MSNLDDVDWMVMLYLALQPLPTKLITGVIVDAQSQHKIIAQTIINPHLITYPPAPEYQRNFWKRFITVLEELNVEIEDKIYEHLISILKSPVEQEPPAASYRTYLLRRPEFSTISTEIWRRSPGIDNFSQDHRPLTILESRTTIERGTTGLRTWRASLDLAEWILHNNHIVTLARVLELGSGAGLLGLFVATLQQLAPPSGACVKKASCMYMTDMDDHVLARCVFNVQLPCNMLGATPNVQVRALDWTDSTDPSRQAHLCALLEEIDAEVILAADVVYDPSIISPLTRTLRLALERPLSEAYSMQYNANNRPSSGAVPPRTAYIALTIRREQTFSEFLASVKKEGITVEFIEMVLPSHRERVFRGSDDSASREDDSTILMRLTVVNANSQQDER